MSAKATLSRGIGVLANWLSLYTRMISPRPVGYIAIESTRRCNLRCKMCNIGQLSADPAFRDTLLGPEAWDIMFRESRLLRLMPKVRITGGEPFIRHDCARLVSLLLMIPYIQEVAIYTNGYLTEKIVAAVESILNKCPKGKRLEIGVSLDDVGERHDIIRGRRGAFDRAVATLKQLRNLKNEFPQLRLGSASVLQPDNLAHIENVDDLRDDLNVQSHYILLQQTSFLGTRKEQNTVVSFTDEQRKAIGELAKHNIELLGAVKWLETGVRPLPCFAGTSSVFIGSNGDVYPCLAMAHSKEFFMGNAADTGFDEVWRSAKASAIRGRVQRCTFSSCWAGCETTATRVQYAPLELFTKYASLGLIDYYHCRGVR